MSINEVIDRAALFQALDADRSREALAFNEIWKGFQKGQGQAEVIERYYECRELITPAGIEKCEQAVMQLKQIEHTLIRLAAPLGAASKRAAQLVIKEVTQTTVDAGVKLKEIRAWTQV